MLEAQDAEVDDQEAIEDGCLDDSQGIEDGFEAPDARIPRRSLSSRLSGPIIMIMAAVSIAACSGSKKKDKSEESGNSPKPTDSSRGGKNSPSGRVPDEVRTAERALAKKIKKRMKEEDEWNKFKRDSKILAAIKKLDEGNGKVLNVEGLDNLFLFERDAGNDVANYTLRLSCDSLDPIVCDYLKRVSFTDIVSKVSSGNSGDSFTFNFNIASVIDSSVRKFLYLIEGLAQIKKRQTNPLFGIPADLGKLKYYDYGRVKALAGGDISFYKMFSYQKDPASEKLHNDPILFRDFLTFERVLISSSKDLKDFAMLVGSDELNRYYSEMSSVDDFEIFVKNLSKIKDKYVFSNRRRVKLPPSFATYIARKLEKLIPTGGGDGNPCAGTEVLTSPFTFFSGGKVQYGHIGNNRYMNQYACYSFSINKNGALHLDGFYTKYSDNPTYSNNPWEKIIDPTSLASEISDSIGSLLRGFTPRGHKTVSMCDSFVGSCSLKKESGNNYSVIANGFKSKDTLFQYVIKSLEREIRNCKITGIESDHIVVQYETGPVVYKVYAVSKDVLRVEVVSINGVAVCNDISNEPASVKNARNRMRYHLYTLIGKGLTDFFRRKTISAKRK